MAAVWSSLESCDVWCCKGCRKGSGGGRASGDVSKSLVRLETFWTEMLELFDLDIGRHTTIHSLWSTEYKRLFVHL